MNIKPYSQRKAMASDHLDKNFLPNLAVFNGIKAISCFYILFVSSFMFTWWAYLAIPQQLDSYKTQVSSLFLYGSYFTPPVLFLVAGFLQTFAFMQTDTDELFTCKNLAKYYAWRLTKFVPILGAMLIFAMSVIPFLGSGPIWIFYERTMKPCEKHWWTVLLQINNIYPTTEFDDKCMPWGWFIPALT